MSSLLERTKQMLLKFSVSQWLAYEVITEYQQEDFPNAKIAAEIKNSPLYKALA